MRVVEGKLNKDGTSSIDPTSATRYPLNLDFRDGLVTLAKYRGPKINFTGSWEMSFGTYHLSSVIDPNGQFQNSASLVSKANCDDIEFYEADLKLMGMSDYDTGEMPVRAGTKITTRDDATEPQEGRARL